MMCPVCKRDLAPTLSICLTCGAMINDTVREELETKISKTGDGVTSGRLSATPSSATSGKLPAQTVPATSDKLPATPAVSQPVIKPKVPLAPPPKPIAARFETADLGIKKTSKTLVEFQAKKAAVPEWRLQLQNSVRQKVGTNRRQDAATDISPAKPRTTSGANALKVEFVEEEQQQPTGHQNPRVASALKRIEESRRAFANQKVAEQPVNVGKNSSGRSFPFNVVAKSTEPSRTSASRTADVNPSPKPKLVSALKIKKKGYDTNKLPPLPKSEKISNSLEIHASPTPNSVAEETRERWETLSVEEKKAENDAVELAPIEDEIEDLAPFAMRFNAGLFDMIIGIFATLILLSPFMLAGGTWLSLAGLFAIGASVAIVMFLYLTISLAFIGRTFGMRLFSLELVDVEENAYPTLHQAAVNSAVFLLSLALAGIGFLPIFFNEERRAAHDILSGTILIREI